MGLVNFQGIWDSYPMDPAEAVLYDIFEKSEKTTKAIKTWVKTFKNVCCIRMSHALNNSGNNIVKAFGINTITGISGEYIINVTNLSKYLLNKYGVPAVTVNGNGEKTREALRGKKGIICFNMNGIGYSGHFDVWNGNFVKYGDHFNDIETYKVSLWTVSG